MESGRHFAFLVIGGGSGGIAAARRAAGYLGSGKVAIAECSRWGGTCVNVGCVPKKISWWAATVRTMLDEVKHYGISLGSPPSFSWAHLKARRDASVARLNSIYVNNLEKQGISHYSQVAKFIGRNSQGFHVQIGENLVVTVDHVLIATGGRPDRLGVPGEELCINSDDFFALEEQPKKAAVIGAGYIAVELAGVFKLLGTDVHQFTRGATSLRTFDKMIQTKTFEAMEKQGIIMHPNVNVKAVEKRQDSLAVLTTNGEVVEGFDVVLCAIGRHPELSTLNLSALANPQLTGQKGHLRVDEFQNTSMSNLYALGDVTGRVELTPMAIAAGRRLADRLFGGVPNAKADYEKVPTVIFAHPPVGSIGLSEEQAEKQFGKERLKIYTGTAVNLYYNVFDVQPEEKPRIHIKLICVLPEEKIEGLHIVGMGADELLQGFGVAIKMGATKADFDACIAIHPTAAEEVCTLEPWGVTKAGK